MNIRLLQKPYLIDAIDAAVIVNEPYTMRAPPLFSPARRTRAHCETLAHYWVPRCHAQIICASRYCIPAAEPAAVVVAFLYASHVAVFSGDCHSALENAPSA